MNKPRVLIVEDNVDTQQMYKDVFERENFNVLVTGDGQSGLSYAQSTLPDVILLDLMLPKIGGMEVLKQLREAEETRNIPVIIFSARNDTRDMQKAAELGAYEYSVKALNTPKQVVARVRSILSRSKQSPTAVPYRIYLKDPGSAIHHLREALGLPSDLQCPQCRVDIVMEITPDNTRTGGPWYATHFVCLTCHKSY